MGVCGVRGVCGVSEMRECVLCVNWVECVWVCGLGMGGEGGRGCGGVVFLRDVHDHGCVLQPCLKECAQYRSLPPPAKYLCSGLVSTPPLLSFALVARSGLVLVHRAKKTRGNASGTGTSTSCATFSAESADVALWKLVGLLRAMLPLWTSARYQDRVPFGTIFFGDVAGDLVQGVSAVRTLLDGLIRTL